MSTTSKKIAEEHELKLGFKKIEKNVSITTLTDICEKYKITTIHFLKIDVEGAEELVLKAIDFSKVQPWIVIVEATMPGTQIENYETRESILLSNNYKFVYFDGLNRFYLLQSYLDLKKYFRAGPNVFNWFIS